MYVSALARLGRRARCVVLGSVTLLLLLPATPAFAASSTTAGRVAGPNSYGYCTWAQGTIADNRPWLNAIATIDGPGPTATLPSGGPHGPLIANGQYACANTSTEIDASRLAVAEDLLSFNWQTGGWDYCNIGLWVVNNTRTHQMTTGYQWWSPPCGDNYYLMTVYAIARPFSDWELYGSRSTNYIAVTR